MSNRVELPPKSVGETRTYQFDFESSLAFGETISSQVVTATVYSGEDATPSAIVDGAATASGSVVSQSITDGEEGVIYDLTCTVETSLSQTLQLSGYLAIVPSLP